MNLTNTNINSKKVIICIHGLQIKGHEHFDPFLEYAKDKLKYEAVTFNYFQHKYPQLKNVLLLFPAFKISWYRWTKGLRKLRRDRKALIKKMGKERYDQAMAKLNQQTKDSLMSGNFFKLSVQNNWTRYKTKKYLAKVRNSNVTIFYANNDWVTSRFNEGYIGKKISLNSNVVKFHRVNSDHTDFIFHSMLADYYDLIIDELNQF